MTQAVFLPRPDPVLRQSLRYREVHRRTSGHAREALSGADPEGPLRRLEQDYRSQRTTGRHRLLLEVPLVVPYCPRDAGLRRDPERPLRVTVDSVNEVVGKPVVGRQGIAAPVPQPEQPPPRADP